MDTGDQVWVVKVGGKSLYLPSHLTVPSQKSSYFTVLLFELVTWLINEAKTNILEFLGFVLVFQDNGSLCNSPVLELAF